MYFLFYFLIAILILLFIIIQFFNIISQTSDKEYKIYLYNYEIDGDKGMKDYTEKLYGLQTYFEDNQVMRNVVADFDEALIIPQYENPGNLNI